MLLLLLILYVFVINLLVLMLGCYPFQDQDPFVIGETPHIFFAGNQPEYGSRLIQGFLRVFFLEINSRGEWSDGASHMYPKIL